MRAIAYLITNIQDVVEAKKRKEELALPRAEEVPIQHAEFEVYFPVRAIQLAFLIEGGKRIKTIQSGQELILKYEDEVWERITAYLKHE